jgi:hypothetical protein
MTIRRSEKTVTFRRPFTLAGFGKEMPAGSYKVETEEELIEGISFPVYRRVATLIHLHAHAGMRQTLNIDPNDLDKALDREKAVAEKPETESAEQVAKNKSSNTNRRIPARLIVRP